MSTALRVFSGALRVFFGTACLWLAACSPAPTPVFHADGYPTQLSDWQILSVAGGHVKLSDDVLAYDLATPLFSDYAHKLRTITLPEGTQAKYHAEETFDFPIGTIISKTFYYPKAKDNTVHLDPAAHALDTDLSLDSIRLIETRLLVKRESGWVAIPYMWDDAQTEAKLKRTGAVKPLKGVSADGTVTPFSYIVPNQNQCAGCHATNNTSREIRPIGPKARHLNRASPLVNSANQLEHWADIDWLQALPAPPNRAQNVAWTDKNATLDERARAYLDINCSHCHSDVGPADTSGLDLRPHVEFGPSFGACKSPIAAGSGSGDRAFDIVPGAPEQSIFTFRLKSTDPSQMMPELGRALAHAEGVTLISDWISEMQGGCG